LTISPERAKAHALTGLKINTFIYLWRCHKLLLKGLQPYLNDIELGIRNQCSLVKHISDYTRTAPVRCFHLTATVLSGEKHLTSAKCRLVKHISEATRTAPVRCFHLTASVLSGEKHLTSAKCRLVKHISEATRTAPVRCFHLTASVL